MKLGKVFLQIVEEKDLEDTENIELDECTNKINTLVDSIKVFTSEAALSV